MGSVLFWLLVAIVIIAFYLINKKQKAIQALKDQQVSMHHSAKTLQQRFKEVVAKLSTKDLIGPETKRRLSAVANNYFVFQSINPINLKHFSDLVDLFTVAIEKYLDDHNEPTESFTELLVVLARHLPEDTRGYTADFYLNTAPGLFYDLSQQIEILANDAEPEQAEDQRLRSDNSGLATDTNATETDDSSALNTTDDANQLDVKPRQRDLG